ncbi:MAG TPA: type II toxin-antitoxin system prevent-host-death family antitoxin [Candidatus Limnocylindrales bacterium]|nr:type II toxin-antitoxin system prevent-host-death family antitoxin [Candidatus Limnocylindrales bacterium]
MCPTQHEKSATMMPPDATTIGVRELRDHLSAYLQRVKAGEAITVTDHGRPIARLVSATYPPRILELAARGGVTLPTRPKRSADEFPRIPVDGSVSDIVSEMRGE